MGTIVFADGFDEYTGAQAASYGWSSSSYTSQTGRVSGSALQLGQSASIYHALPSDAAYCLGVAWNTSNIGGSATGIIAALAEGGTTHVSVRYNPDGSLSIVQGNGTVIATSAPIYLTARRWIYVELDAVIHDTLGEVELHVDGASVIPRQTGEDTRNSGTGVITRVQFGTCQNVGGVQVGYDDLVCTKGGGFQGDCRIITQLPTGDGAMQQWAPSAAGSHYTMVDDANLTTPDGDYVSDATPNDYDTYTFPALGVAGTVKAVAVSAVTRKDDTATRQVCPTVRSGGANYDGDTVTQGTGYAAAVSVWPTNPNGGGAWSVATVNAAECGVKTVA